MQSFRKPLRPGHNCLRLRAIELHGDRCQRRHASTAAAIASATPADQTIHTVTPIARFPPTQPPSHKPPEFRKSQLLRSYASLLRSSPLILLFQHNNIRSTEWMALRREIAVALRKLEESRASEAGTDLDTTISSGIKLHILQTGIFAAALRIVEFYHPEQQQQQQQQHHHHPSSPPPPLLPSTSTSPSPFPDANDPQLPSSTPLPNATPSPADPTFTHTLSRHAHDAVVAAHRPHRPRRAQHQQPQTHGLEPLLSGPLCALAFPSLSPAHLAVLIRLLAPAPPRFPAPRRREQPGYHDPAVQAAVQKLLLLGARVEGRALDGAGVEWVGGMEGGLEGLRGRLVGLLQGVGMGLVGALDGAGRAVYGVMEGRRRMLDEEQNATGSEGQKEDGA
ncbi:MAG: hypothetical protein M1821_005536 [Bathelium mastoideum]|nr:MAG: hypothetical protein M1821_005536 [Bathelium mastoideum]